MKENVLLFLLFFLAYSLTAQEELGLGLGYAHAHGNDELRLYYSHKKGRKSFQIGMEIFLNPQGEASKEFVFEGKRFAYDSLDYVGLFGRYMFDLGKKDTWIKPYIGLETQFAPTSMRLNLLDRDGMYKNLAIRDIYYWDTYALLGLRMRLHENFSLHLNAGYGFVWILGIGSEHNFVTKTGQKLDSAFFSNLSVQYEF